MKTFKLFTIAIILVSTFACKRKKTETLYFNCYINGQFFSPEKQQGLGEYPLTAKLLYDGIDFRIDASKGIQNVFLWVKDSNLVLSKQYQLYNTPDYYSRAYFDKNIGEEYTTDSINSGIIDIVSIDKTNQIVEGTFFFNAYNSTHKDTVYITDGKFRLKYDLH